MLAGDTDAGGQMATPAVAADDYARSQPVLGWEAVYLPCCSCLTMEVGRQMSN